MKHKNKRSVAWPPGHRVSQAWNSEVVFPVAQLSERTCPENSEVRGESMSMLSRSKHCGVH